MEAGKWYQVGSPFVALDDTASTQKINEVFTIGFSEGDSINILNTAAMEYVAYYWKTSANGWCTKRGTTPVDVTINVGQAVFIQKAVAGDVTLSGKVEVAQATQFGSTTGNAWNQIVCVYPQDMNLNDMKWDGVADGDVINILDNTGATPVYNGYYWKTSAKGWCTKRGTTPVDVKIPAGQALFVNKASAGIGSVSAQ